MIHVVWTVAVNYLVALCIYAVASLTLAGGQGCCFNGRALHHSSKYVLRGTPPIDRSRFFIFPIHHAVVPSIHVSMSWITWPKKKPLGCTTQNTMLPTTNDEWSAIGSHIVTSPDFTIGSNELPDDRNCTDRFDNKKSLII